MPYEKNIEKIKKIRDEGLKKEKEERELVELCDLTTAVSDVDSQYYKSLTKNKNKIKLFSNVIDLDDYEKEEKSPGLNKPNVYLAGTFWPGSPMENAARWFVNNVFEIIKKEIPAIHFYILGRDSDKILSDMKDENITILGRVENASSYLKDSDVAIVPLFFESGTRFKILEAGACGIPLVSTVLGAEGLPVESGRDILLADDPQDFANAVIELIRNKKFANRIAQNCRELVCEKYGLEKLKAEGKQILDYF